MVHRTIDEILARLKSEKFNSLEITRVASEASKRFLGVRYVTVSAQSRHIQGRPDRLPLETKRFPSDGTFSESNGDRSGLGRPRGNRGTGTGGQTGSYPFSETCNHLEDLSEGEAAAGGGDGAS